MAWCSPTDSPSAASKGPIKVVYECDRCHDTGYWESIQPIVTERGKYECKDCGLEFWGKQGYFDHRCK